MRGYPGLCIALREEVLYGLRRASPEKEQTTWKDKRNYNNGFTISPWMMAFLMLMTGFAGFVDSAAGGGGLISLPAYLFAGLPPHYTYATTSSAPLAAPPLPRRSSSRREP